MNNRFNKNDMVSYLRNTGGFKAKDANKAVDAVFQYITHSLEFGDSVVIKGFGTFKVTYIADKEIFGGQKVPAHYAPKFIAGQNLKKAVIDMKEGK